MRIKKKRCGQCHQWFRPHPRKVSIQNVCLRRRCQRKRHARNCRRWRKANPTHDEGRRSKMRDWAQEKEYWKRYRQEHPSYCRKEAARMRSQRRKAKAVAKRDSIREIAVGKLREIQEMSVGIVAKRDSMDRRVDGLLALLIWKESVAKRDSPLGAPV
jgi:hypothetical protein